MQQLPRRPRSCQCKHPTVTEHTDKGPSADVLLVRLLMLHCMNVTILPDV